MIFGGARWKRYGQTKFANAAFTAALHEKLQKRGSKIKSLVAHLVFQIQNFKLLQLKMEVWQKK